MNRCHYNRVPLYLVIDLVQELQDIYETFTVSIVV